jgi:flagellar protein FlaG
MSSINTSSAAVANFVPVADRVITPPQGEPAKATPVASVKPVADISDTAVRQALDVVNQAVAMEQRSLNFSIDDVSGRAVIKVTDFATNELIKQIPTEELLKVAQDIKRLQEEMGQSIGLLIDKKV